MLNVLRRGQRRVEAISPTEGWQVDPDVIWIDLLRPTREEELAVEAALQVELPTMEEMAALEPSSRLYQEGASTFMTATLLAHSGKQTPVATPATFVLTAGILVSIRYHEMRAFDIFSEQSRNGESLNGAKAFLGLLDAIVERLARILDDTESDVAEASTSIFKRPEGGNFRPLMNILAQTQSLSALARTSLLSLNRLLSFATLAHQIVAEKDSRAHLKSLQRDAQSLTEHTGHLSAQVTFLLDAALGLINIEQNSIIKFFSVVAVVFMPPTLIASIYGMNFDVLPELHWKAGYPLALASMVIAAVAPLLWFKRRGWL